MTFNLVIWGQARPDFGPKFEPTRISYQNCIRIALAQGVRPQFNRIVYFLPCAGLCEPHGSRDAAIALLATQLLDKFWRVGECFTSPECSRLCAIQLHGTSAPITLPSKCCWSCFAARVPVPESKRITRLIVRDFASLIHLNPSHHNSW